MRVYGPVPKGTKQIFIAAARVWARWYLIGRPKFTLYDVILVEPDNRTFHFRSRRTGLVEIKTYDEIFVEAASGAFGPFCVDTARMEGNLVSY